MPFDYNLEPFKEPKGFLKVLQWLFAICAFASTVNFSTDFEFRAPITCTNNTPANASVLVTKTVQYPFDLDQPHQKIQFHLNEIKGCESNQDTLKVYFIGNAKSDSEFFVTTGVLSFLYATALIVIYLLANRLYADNSNAPIIDFACTVILAVFWLSGSAAWANGLSDLKSGSNPQNFLKDRDMFEPKGIVVSDIIPIRAGTFGGIVISILFGFINFILWAANLWFLYKETTWFESIMKNASPTSPAGGSTTG